jgi:hypothetical protein
VPLQLRQKGHLVNAKFNRPNGPLQATVEFDKEGEKEAQNEAKTEQKAGGEKPALSTRAEFRFLEGKTWGSVGHIQIQRP